MSTLAGHPLVFAASITAAAAASIAIAVPSAPTAAEAATVKPRLTYGPQVYRLKPTGAKFGRQEETSYKYAIVFLPSKSVIGPTFQGEGGSSAGDFSIAGVPAPDYTHSTLYSKPRRPQRCTVAYINADDSEITNADLRKLDRIKVGQRVRVTIRPLASDLPNVSYGRTYHRTVQMRQGSKYTLTEASVQRQLKAIHCNRR